MNEYERIWAEFLAARELADHWRDWVAWAGPCNTHLVFLARVGNDDQVAERVALIQQALKTAGGLDLHPRRFLHLTVQAFGFLAEDGLLTPEQVSAQDVPLAIERVRQALVDQPALAVRLGGANSFYSSGFVEVYDDGRLGALRRRLQAVLPRLGAGDSWPEYLFHLTVAYYRGGDYKAVRSAIERLRNLPPIELHVRQLELVAVHTDRARLYPPMITLARFPLATG